MYSIDVGQGDATLIIGPDGETTLVDAGTGTEAKQNIRENIDRRFATRDDVDGLDNVVVTHFDQDHADQAADMVEEYDVDEVYTPNPNAYDTGDRITNTSGLQNEALSKVDVSEETDTTVHSVDTDGTQRAVGAHDLGGEGQQDLDIFSDGAVDVSVLNPEPTEDIDGIDRNSGSLSFSVEYGDSTAVITSDTSELAAPEKLDDTEVDYATGFEHGSETSLTTLNQVDPEHVNFSCDPSAFGHPDTAMTDVAAERGLTVTATNEHGTVSFMSDGDSDEVLTQRGEPIDGSQTDGEAIQDELTDSQSNPEPGFADEIAKVDDATSQTELTTETGERTDMDLITEEGEQIEPDAYIEEDLDIPENTEDIDMFPERGNALDVDELESAGVGVYNEETGRFETPNEESLTDIDGVGTDKTERLEQNGIDIDSTPTPEEVSKTDGFNDKLSNRVSDRLEQRNSNGANQAKNQAVTSEESRESTQSDGSDKGHSERDSQGTESEELEPGDDPRNVDETDDETLTNENEDAATSDNNVNASDDNPGAESAEASTKGSHADGTGTEPEQNADPDTQRNSNEDVLSEDELAKEGQDDQFTEEASSSDGDVMDVEEIKNNPDTADDGVDVGDATADGDQMDSERKYSR
ncbi:MBL fold metallo-hydrolase [Halorubrum ejinorense]